MEDVDDVRELVAQRMRNTGFEESIFDEVMELLDRFDTNREAVFEEMLDELEEPGHDGLSDQWASSCERAQALLRGLEEEMTSILEESEANALDADERMAAVGPQDFLAGERAIWTAVARLDVPQAAALISKVLDTNVAIIDKCEEDLENARSNDKIVEQLLAKNFATITQRAKDLVRQYAQLPTGIARLVVLFMKDPSSRAAATEAIQAFEKLAGENLEAAKQKRAAKQVVLDNIKLLTDAREQLDEEWIERVFARGAEAAAGWRGIGQTGDYQATDWDGMKDAVIAELDTRAVAAREQSNRLYEELYPAFIEESTEAFAQLTDDPETLQKFTEELQTTFTSLEDLLANESDYAADLTDGDYKQTAVGQLELTKSAIRAGWDMLFAKTKQADDEVKE